MKQEIYNRCHGCGYGHWITATRGCIYEFVCQRCHARYDYRFDENGHTQAITFARPQKKEFYR